MPEPLRSKAGHGIHPPVHEDAQLGLIIPAGEGPGVQGLPGGLVLREDSREGNNEKDKGHTGPRGRHSLSKPPGSLTSCLCTTNCPSHMT